jgi:hypothetical protein
MAIVNTSTLIPQEKKKKSIIESISRTALIPSVVIGNAITGSLEKKANKYAAKIGAPAVEFKRTTTKEAADTTTGKILGSAIAATGAALVVASGAAAKVLSTPTNKAVGLLVAGGASVSPTITKAVIEAPAALVDTGIKIGQEVEKLPQEVTENKGVGGLILAGAGGIGAGIGITSAVNFIKDKFSNGSEGVTKDAGLLGNSDIIKDSGIVTPQTQPLSKTSTSTRKKKRYKAQPSKISQSVRINIANSNTAHRITKKYINHSYH